jgi:type II secretory pathway component GspD/PulD (secretin)
MNIKKRRLLNVFLSLLICVGISGCLNHLKYHDPNLKLSKEEARDTFTPPTHALPKTAHASPRLSVGNTPLSVTLSPNTPLRDVLWTLGEQAEMNIVLDPKIGSLKGVNYKASGQPFFQIIDHICRISNLRYDIEGNSVYIAPDGPYLKTYDIQFLIGSRKTENSMSVSTEMNTKDGRGGLGNSNTTISSTSSVNFWEELKQNIKTILTLSRNPESGGKGKLKEHFAIHQQAGLLSIYGTQNQHRLVTSYLKRVKKLIHSQVLIEAKIVEVALKDQYETGINWAFVNKRLQSFGLPTSLNGDSSETPGAILNIHNGQLDFAMRLMERFGTARTIANPRLTVLNNQSAIFKVAKNEVFFTLQTEHTFTSNNQPYYETYTSQIQTVPVGLVMTVQPSIDPETNQVTLFVKPSISRADTYKDDPAVAIKSGGKVPSKVPVVQVREMDSMVKVKPGQVVIMGGLIEKSAQNDSSTLPGLSGTLLGRALGNKSDRSQLCELVIFLTVHLVDDAELSKHEKFLYQKI